MAEDLIRRLALRQGPTEERVNLYAAKGVLGNSEVLDFSCGGRYYVVFRSPSGTDRTALDAASGRGRFVNRIDETGAAEQIVEISDWPVIEVAIRKRLIVEACLPMVTVDETGQEVLGEYRIDTAKNPGQVAEELNQRIGHLLPVLSRMILDYYYERGGQGDETVKVVEEAGNC